MFNAKRHYNAPAVTWNETTVRHSIAEIAASVAEQAASGTRWQKHPLDAGGQIKSDFYFGRGGALWALDYLQRRGAVETVFDITPELDQLVSDNRKYRKRTPHPENASYLFGVLPLLMMQFQRNPDSAKADEIASAIAENNDQPVRELMWGLAGSMLAATFMSEWTGEKHWGTLYRKQARLMLNDWQAVRGVGHLWHVEVYSKQNYFLGPVHGFSGNALALIKGFPLLTQKQVTQITTRVMTTTVNTAHYDDNHANWWPTYSPDNTGKPLVQFCHGAPGMIIPLASLPVGLNEEFDEMLLKGGELIWHAGLLEKGPSLCHGTSGNGYAFLKLYQRTGDDLWLQRARTYAMHCIEQYKEITGHYKLPRFPLWTGDPGMAIYLWDCIEAGADFPTLDVF